MKYFADEFAAGTHTAADELFDPVAATVFATAEDDDDHIRGPPAPWCPPATSPRPSTTSRSWCPKGTLVIRAAEQLGIEIPRFCDHPLLEPVAACRMCLIEIEGMPKPQPACAIPLTDGMVVRTQQTSTVADVAQRGVMEFLLVNHPLDCPVCDKGGECPLQNRP